MFFLLQRRKKRNFGPNWRNWPLGIVPYVFDSSIGMFDLWYLSNNCFIVSQSLSNKNKFHCYLIAVMP